ncbi:dUTP diphosphatase [Clostridium tertium]|uniref:dUTP diphosphatase n=1 Tax=Clostridium tertium TaxID=1559 RepID=UPI0023B24A6D|nr:dUTP diphosphatase [Clostridium tertium]
MRKYNDFKIKISVTNGNYKILEYIGHNALKFKELLADDAQRMTLPPRHQLPIEDGVYVCTARNHTNYDSNELQHRFEILSYKKATISLRYSVEKDIIAIIDPYIPKISVEIEKLIQDISKVNLDDKLEKLNYIKNMIRAQSNLLSYPWSDNSTLSALACMLIYQIFLDKANFAKAHLNTYPYSQISLAYKVELGELAQEWKEFKYWKINKGDTDREKLVEEWADCMHFALSITNYNSKIGYTLEDMLSLASVVIDSSNDLDIYDILDKCYKGINVLGNTVRLGLKLGFTLEELEEAYYTKNRINWTRVMSDY